MNKIIFFIASLYFFSSPAIAGEWMITNEGCKSWNPNPEKGESVTWSGLCVDGYANGYGEEQWYSYGTKGNKLIGIMKNGKFIDGEKIEIYLPKDLKVFDLHLGKIYKGTFSNNQRNGYGIEIFENGNQYEGEFKDNYRNGSGIYTYANGMKQEGIWSNNIFVRKENYKSKFVNEDKNKNKNKNIELER
jgi:hypothetical protein